MKKEALKPLMPESGSTPAKFRSGDATAVQALAGGTADADQQKRALKWILEGACALPQWAYRADQRETDIALGRQFVGQQIVGLTKVNVSKLKQREESTNG